MFGKPSIKMDSDLYERAARVAAQLGHPSVERYVAVVMERELKAHADEETKQKVLQKMKGLGYLQ
jgi:hypothetical protein